MSVTSFLFVCVSCVFLVFAFVFCFTCWRPAVFPVGVCVASMFTGAASLVPCCGLNWYLARLLL